VDAIEEFRSKNFFKPIKSGNKTIILFVSQDKDREVRSLEDVSDEIRNILALENKNRARADYIKELKKKAHIKIFVPSLAE
jgi:parvulin-like peptidyl-prolyl isomerase